MKIVDVNNAEPSKNPHNIKARRVYDTKHAQVSHLTLYPGESLKKHITPVDVIFYVLEGIGIVEIGDEEKEVGKDILIDSPAGIVHCWYNKGKEPLKILVIKVPRPAKPTKIL